MEVPVNVAAHLPDMDGLLMLIYRDCVLILQLSIEFLDEMLAIKEVVKDVGGVRAMGVCHIVQDSASPALCSS